MEMMVRHSKRMFLQQAQAQKDQAAAEANE